VSGESAGVGGVVFRPKQSRFLTIPQSPLSYWLRERFFDLLAGPTLATLASCQNGVTTYNNNRFLRKHWEILRPSKTGYLPFLKGGGFARWAGLDTDLLRWGERGERVKAYIDQTYPYLQGNYGWALKENTFFKFGWAWTLMARGALGVRRLNGTSVFDSACPAAFADHPLPSLGVVLNCRASSYMLRSICSDLKFRESYVARAPISAALPATLSALEAASVELKKHLVSYDLIERSYRPVIHVSGHLLSSAAEFSSASAGLSAVLHALEGKSEFEVFNSFGISGADLAAVLDETGTPAGWHPLIAGYDAIPPLPEDLNIDPELLAPLKDHPRIAPTPNELADLKRRLRALYEAGPGASPDAEEVEAADSDDDESEEAVVSGARIPIPPETFLEELSQKLEIHPISIYWLLRELREKDGAVCLPELRRFVSDHFTVMVLRMLGHRWPRQIEANEPIPEWAEPSGIIPITEGARADSLLSRVRQRIVAEFGAERVSAIEREFEEIMGVALKSWLARDFFRNHISQFRKRPIAWQIQSTPETSGASGNGRGKRARRKTHADRTPIFSCLVYYHRLDDQLLGTIRTQYAHPMRLRMETELRELERIDAKARTVEQEQRRAGLIVRIEELKDFEARLERVEQAGFESEALAKIADKEPLDKWTSRDGEREHPRERDAFMAQERRYDPDINDGVRVNIAPLQKAGLLAADVLAAKDLDKAISDRAQWRGDERRWCREGKLPRPGWWK
jgi:hypothetical protein